MTPSADLTALIEPKRLDEKGRCCGRKPLFYRTKRGAGIIRDPHYFCGRCCAEFDEDGDQRANWKYPALSQTRHGGSDGE